MLADNGEQRRLDVRRHASGIAADVQMRAVLQPCPELRAVLGQAVLHIDLVLLIARERDVEAREHALIAPAEPVGLVEEVELERAVAEHEPVVAFRPRSLALGDEDQPLAYGDNPKRDMAGVFERIGPFRWRLVIPWPQGSSKLDVFELTPVTNQPK